jgi:hypothetical protein
LIELIDQDGDMAMPELAGALADATGVQVYPDGIGGFLRKLGLMSKKRHWSPASGVFIDETAVKTNLTRQRGWSQRGERLVMDAPLGRWGTQTFIAGLDANALITPWFTKEVIDGEAFLACVPSVLLSELERAPTASRTISAHTRMPLPPRPCAQPDAGAKHPENVVMPRGVLRCLLS